MARPPDEMSLLLSRLTHPSGMVREKACTALAGLLLRHDTQMYVFARLQSWLEVQQLESVAILALLVHIRANIINPTCGLPQASELIRKISRPSILSWMLATELYRTDVEIPVWKGLCSEDAPSEFEIDQFFVKYAPSLVGEILMRQAKEITEKTHYCFTIQWAWESSLLVRSTGLTIRDRVFWQRGDSDSEWYACYNFRLTDILLSAFLRTLAWAIKKKAMGLGRAKWSAAVCCPIDLALWKVQPRSRPSWWPGLETHKEVIETSTREVVASLEKAFKEFISGECEWLPVLANGFVGGDGTKMFLEIYGLLQWCVGSKEPDISEIVRWCGSIVSSTFSPHSILATTGTIGPKSLHLGNRQRQFADWVLAPAFEIIPFASGINWQWWRHYRKLWGPANFLMDSPLLMEPTRDGMIFRIEDQDVAQWFDWGNLVRATVDANLPPCTGQCLQVKRKLLAKVVAPMQPNLCWFWSITIFHRPYQNGRYEMVTHNGQLGSTSLVRT